LYWFKPLIDSWFGYYAAKITMPRPSRADEAGGLYHALHRGNLCAEIFHKDEHFAAFERILHEGFQLQQVQLFSYQLMPNHYHLVFRPLIDGEMSRFMDWVGGTYTMRYHAQYHTSGLRHLHRLGLELTMRPRGRQRVRPVPEGQIKEA
jgi:putative transposase